MAQVSSRYFTNQVETANNNVKDWLGRSNKFPVAIRQTEEYVAAQQQEFEIAIYGNGPYERVMLICEKLVIFVRLLIPQRVVLLIPQRVVFLKVYCITDRGRRTNCQLALLI